MRDVAQRAGVAPSTVSRVLNGAPTVDAELTERVMRAVDELGYQRNRLARNLRRQGGTVWALIISDIENPFFTSLARGVEDVAIEAGLSVVLCNTDEKLHKERRYIDVALAEQVAGVILSPASDCSDVAALGAGHVPTVTVDRQIRDADLDSILVDNHAGALQATAHLLHAGYERVACISGPTRATTAAERVAGYEEALRKTGKPVLPDLIRAADFRVEGGYGAASALMELAEPPDALFVANNLMAAGALAALHDAHASVPGAVGVVGFDDSPWASLTAPRLTTVAQPTYHMGETAAQLLLRRTADGETPPQVVTLPTELRVRESSRGPG